MTCVNSFNIQVYSSFNCVLEKQVCILNGKSGKVDNWLIICMLTLSFPPKRTVI